MANCMNYYVNCTPRTCEEYESVTLDIPTEYIEEVLQLARTLADERNSNARKAFSDIVRQSYQQLIERNYERQNRKNGQRRGRNR